MFQRNLLYTAMTRSRKLVVLVGTLKALAIAIKNMDARRRVTLLRQSTKKGPWIRSPGPNSGGRIRTSDLRVMGPTSYQTALPRGQ